MLPVTGNISGLKHRERLVLEFIIRFIRTHGYAPCHRDFAANSYLDWKDYRRQLTSLEDKGLILRTPHIQRSIRLCDGIATPEPLTRLSEESEVVRLRRELAQSRAQNVKLRESISTERRKHKRQLHEQAMLILRQEYLLKGRRDERRDRKRD
jgi:SOS-response transcriptional repressor LexA